MKKTKILIEMVGGLISAISANTEKVEIVVVDYDGEDWDPNPNTPGHQTIEGSAWMQTERQPDDVKEKLYMCFEGREISNQEKYAYQKLKEIDF